MGTKRSLRELKAMRRSAARRNAFTLVELLVVISIIGMLMALLFPAVQQARETARGNTCRNNIRNLAVAVSQYEKKAGSYPGYVNEIHPREVQVNGNRTERSWVFMALPFLERNDIYEPYTSIPNGAGGDPMNWTNNLLLAQQPAQSLEIAQCPSNPPDGLSVAPPTSFVPNTGLPDEDATTTTPREWPTTGVFHDVRPFYDGSGNLLPITRVAESFVSNGDGTTNTMMLTENIDADSWVLTPYDTATLVANGTPEQYERRMGCNWTAAMSQASSAPGVPDGVVGPPNGMRPNQELGLDTVFTVWDGTLTYARPSAYHPGTFNVAFCDTHVRPLSQDIDYAVLCRLFTPRGRAARAPGTVVALDPVHTLVPLDEKDLQ
jgi:prepilin-type N-terminal cleavage/methylation domain-containing protein/prepilin-type processing-associated H-X9-DG protein